MASNATNREVARDKLVALLTTALVASNKAHAVYSGKVAKFEGSPVVVVTSSASLRERKYQGDKAWHNWFAYNIWVFVSYAMGDQEAEDRLDLLEKMIADVVMDNTYLSGFWDIVEFSEPTDVANDVVIGGKAYRREIGPIRVRVGHG